MMPYVIGHLRTILGPNKTDSITAKDVWNIACSGNTNPIPRQSGLVENNGQSCSEACLPEGKRLSRIEIFSDEYLLDSLFGRPSLS